MIAQYLVILAFGLCHFGRRNLPSPVKEEVIKKRIVELDALRGIAALMVVLFHFTKDRPEQELGFKLGVTGVDIFFMISGFVIFMSLRHIKRGREFVINRFARLYPTYWAAVTFTFIAICAKAFFSNDPNVTAAPISHYLANMTMFQHYFRVPDLDGPYWTMIVEMLFYLLMLALFKLNLLKHIRAIGFLICLAVLTNLIIVKSGLLRNYSFICPLLDHFPLFYAGIIFYKIFIKAVKSNINYLILAFCLVLQVAIYDQGGRAKYFISQMEYAGMLIFFFGVFWLFIKGKLKFIISKPSLFLGKISFSLYLIHQFISIDVIIPYLEKQLGINFWISCAMTLPVVLILGSLVTFFIEIPYSARLKQYLRGKFLMQESKKVKRKETVSM